MNNLENIQEEIFCLQYELNALSEVILKNEAERWIPGFIHSSTEHDHVERYLLATKYAQNKVVLDIACGVGKGTYTLAERGNAAHVFGCDINSDAIRYAKYRNAHDRINFEIQDGEKYIKPDCYDLVVSFETIEHLKNADLFLKNVYTSLKRGGKLIISTPISHLELNKTPSNPYHIQEWGFRSFQELISKYFSINKVFIQLYPASLQINNKVSIIRRLRKKIVNIVLKKSPKVPMSVSKLSVIEEFCNQYSEDELGKTRIGYQILIVEKD